MFIYGALYFLCFVPPYLIAMFRSRPFTVGLEAPPDVFEWHRYFRFRLVYCSRSATDVN